jgi:hypothetical protein
MLLCRIIQSVGTSQIHCTTQSLSLHWPVQLWRVACLFQIAAYTLRIVTAETILELLSVLDKESVSSETLNIEALEAQSTVQQCLVECSLLNSYLHVVVVALPGKFR